MQRRTLPCFALAVSLATLAGSALAQRAPYGPPISLDHAAKALAAAEQEARKNGWSVAIAVLDSGCNLVALHKLDNTNHVSTQIAQEKAATACGYRAPTKVLQELLAKGGDNLRYLQFPRMLAADGGVPILVGGKLVGAIGVSGVTSEQDGQVARAGAAALE